MSAPANPTQLHALPKLPAPPSGAQQPEEVELNEGIPKLTVADPDVTSSDGTKIPDTGIPGDAIPGAQQPVAEPEDLVVFQRTQIPLDPELTPRRLSHTAEPNVAAKGDRVLVTWNWGAAVSRDGGETFDFVDTFSEPPPADGGYCCDQLVSYVASHDLWIWVLQYSRDGVGNNRIRIAASQGDAGFDALEFNFWDWTPQMVGVPGLWLDQPKIASSDNYLYLSVNSFTQGKKAEPGKDSEPATFQKSIIIRMPLRDLASGESLEPTCLTSDDFGPTFTQGASNTMYFAAHVFAPHRSESTYDELRVWSWPEGDDLPTSFDVKLFERYPDTGAHSCLRTQAQSKDADWCRGEHDGRPGNDIRLTAGWVAVGVIGFGWNVSQDPATGWEFPAAWVVRLDESTKEVLDYPSISSSAGAYQYLAASPNERGDLGGVVLYGGGEFQMGCAAVMFDGASGGWSRVSVDQSENDSDEAKSGDYLGVAQDGANPNVWVGACMTLHGGSSRANIKIQFVRFGLQQDAPAG